MKERLLYSEGPWISPVVAWSKKTCDETSEQSSANKVVYMMLRLHVHTAHMTLTEGHHDNNRLAQPE